MELETLTVMVIQRQESQHCFYSTPTTAAKSLQQLRQSRMLRESEFSSLKFPLTAMQ